MMKAAVSLTMMVSAVAASAKDRPAACLERDEAAMLMTVMVPAIVEAAAEQCGPALPEGTFLRSQSGPLVQRLRAEIGQPNPALLGVFEKMSGTKLPRGLSAETMTRAVEESVKGEIKDQIAKMRKDQCSDLNEVVETLAQLPAARLGHLVVALATLAGKSANGDLPICGMK